MWRRRNRDLDQEIQSHLEMAIRDRMERGETREQAEAAARRQFGNAGLVKEVTREMWGWASLDRLVQDVRYASRMMRKNPLFAGIVVLILALSIGSSASVFTLLNAIVLKNLPVRAPQELVWFRDPSFSYPVFEEVRTRAGFFSGVFAWDIEQFNVSWNTEVQQAQVLLVSGEFYSTLGVEAAAGRTLEPLDQRTGGGAQGPVAVISYSCWQRRFGGAAAAIGKTVQIEKKPFTIIGVTPPGFFGVAVGLSPEITIPVTAVPDPSTLTARNRSWLHIMGRLKPGVTQRQADSALQVFWPQILETTTALGMPADRRQRYLSQTTGLVPGGAGYSGVRNQFAEPLWMLLALVGLLLLVACGTVANLLLAKAGARQREIAVRIALGASRGRLARQLFTEGLFLASLGGIGGWLLSIWLTPSLVVLLSTRREPLAVSLAPDWRVLAFLFAVTLLTTLLVTIAPAFRATRAAPGPALKETNRMPGASPQGWWLGKSLVVTQVALSMLLVIGAALFMRSLQILLTQDAGFQRQNILVVHADAVFAGRRGNQLASFYNQLLDRLRSLPGVQSASLSWFPPITNEMGNWTQSISIDGGPFLTSDQANPRVTYFNAVSPGYFETMGMSVLQGRDFGPQDHESGPRTVIINESLARVFTGQNPLGRRITIGRAAGRKDLEVVGIVKDAKYQRLQEPTRRIAYLPYSQLEELAAGANLVAEVRTSMPTANMAATIRREIRALDGDVPVRLETVTERIQESLVKERVITMISTFLGAVALLLASAGLYGLMAYAVSCRTREVGIRIALGATQPAVLWMVLRESLLLTGLGVVVGLAGALALGRFVVTLLFGMTPSDPLALAAASLLMTAVAALAGYLPARKAARIDPMVALRQD